MGSHKSCFPERHKVQDKMDANDGDDVDMCTEEETNESDDKRDTSPDEGHEMIAFTPKRKREAAEKANNSIHSLLVKKPQLVTLTMPKTPDVMK